MPAKPTKFRLDELLLMRGWSSSRTQAKALILSGNVRQGCQVLDKPGKIYPEDVELTLIQPPRFVSRGGEKLATFIESFSIPVEGRTLLDVGASTGGFTDCLLQRGANSAVCVDVGHAQLHPKLANDPRVVNLEGINARYLRADQLPRPDYALIVADLSFISLRLVLPALWPLLQPKGQLIVLVKPQFEADKRIVDASCGIIRDPSVHQAVLERIKHFCAKVLSNSQEIGSIPSPLLGRAGNREFLLGLTKEPLVSRIH